MKKMNKLRFNLKTKFLIYKTIIRFFNQKVNHISNISITNVEYSKNRCLYIYFIIRDNIIYDINIENNIKKYILILSDNFNLYKCNFLKKYFGYIPKICFKYDIKFLNLIKFNEAYFINNKLST